MAEIARYLQDLARRIGHLEASRERPIWTEFTPVVKQGGGSIPLEWTHSYYWLYAGTCFLTIDLKFATPADGVAANDIMISGWPTAVNAAYYDEMAICGGSAWYYDASVPVTRVGAPRFAYDGSFINTAITIIVDGAASDRDLGIDPAITVHDTDMISIHAWWRV